MITSDYNLFTNKNDLLPHHSIITWIKGKFIKFKIIDKENYKHGNSFQIDLYTNGGTKIGYKVNSYYRLGKKNYNTDSYSKFKKLKLVLN